LLHGRADPRDRLVDARRRDRLDSQLVARERQPHQVRGDQFDAEHGVIHSELGALDTATHRMGAEP
jgi:hypothetical protein